jgi:hypothetical protein
MTDAVDLLIRARFDAVANSRDDGDWTDVLARAHGKEIPVERSLRRGGFWRRVPARVALVAAVVALVAVVTAFAFGWPQRIVDFFSAPPAPTNVKSFVGTFGLGAPPGMDPRAIPGQTRKIMTARFFGRLNTLYVAPTKSGGFCELWSGWGFGGCVAAESPPTLRPSPRGPLGVDFGPGHLVHGWVRLGATRTVEARFADGTTATILPTWVSAPINAGFIAYRVPRSQWDRAHALTSVVALDANGRVIGTISPRRHVQSRRTLTPGSLRRCPTDCRPCFRRARKLPRRERSSASARQIVYGCTSGWYRSPEAATASSRMEPMGLTGRQRSAASVRAWRRSRRLPRRRSIPTRSLSGALTPAGTPSSFSGWRGRRWPRSSCASRTANASG